MCELNFLEPPLLSFQQLLNLFQPLAHKTISGTIFLDHSIFQTPEYSSDWMIADIGTGYSTLVFAMNIDFNLISVHVPCKGNGQKAQASNDLNYAMVTDVTTTDQATRIELYWIGENLYFKGTLNPRQFQ